jgi:hypothetical protein
LRAAKPGYLRAEFGALRPEGDGTPIALASSQRLTDVTLTMTRTGSVSGIVRDADGRPAADIFVGLNRPNQPGEFGLEKTKADGTYRIDDVPAGEYYVVAGMMRNADAVPTFYPSSASAAQATTVKVKNSEERDHIDISLVRASPTAIRGVIVDPSGMPARDVRVSIIPYSGFIGVNGCTAEPDGTFACLGVSPGRYTLFPSTNRVEPSASSRPIPEFKSIDALEAKADLDVPFEGLSNVVLQLRRGLVFSGRVEFDRVKLPRPTSFEDFEIRLDRPGWKPYGAKVKEDGTFVWSGLPALLTLSAGGPPGWRLRSATWQGKDLLETGLDLNDSTGDVTGVVLTYTDRPAATIAGVVKSEGGSIDPVCTVIIFPTSSGPWPAFSPRIASDRPATNGKFEFRYLPPGDYYLATVRDLGEGDWRTPEFLRPLIGRATRVTLREGEQLNVTLRSPVESPPSSSVSSVRRVFDPLQ